MANLYPHDCDQCFFLGNTIYEGRTYDLYLHDSNNPDSENHTTLLARESGEGGDYISGVIFSLIHLFRGDPKHPLAVALERCHNRGWVNTFNLRLKITDYAYAQCFYQPHITRSKEEMSRLLDLIDP